MLHWSLMFFVVAIIAAVFGFGGIASGAAAIGQICFFFFIIAFVASLLWHLFGGSRTNPRL